MQNIQVAKTPDPQPVASPEHGPQQVVGGHYGTTLASDVSYGTKFTGDATYYGSTTEGNCGFKGNVPGMYSGMIPSETKTEEIGAYISM